MTIQFQCPYCRQPYKVRDDLAGKKVNCKECKKVVTVPAVDHAVLDHLAVSVLADEQPPAPVADGIAGTVEVECPMCAETVQFPAAMAGKRAPCPSCRQFRSSRLRPSRRPSPSCRRCRCHPYHRSFPPSPACHPCLRRHRTPRHRSRPRQAVSYRSPRRRECRRPASSRRPASRSSGVATSWMRTSV